MKQPQNEYRWESIGREIKVCVSSQHTFGTDSFLLADFAAPKPKDRAVDLGTGCGIIPLLWFREDLPATAYGVELQPQAVEQLEASIEASGLEGRFLPLAGDLREIRTLLPAGEHDLVVCNPPYSSQGSGIESPAESRLIARHETQCTMEDVSAAAAWLLRTGGRFCVCQLPERLVDVMDSMRRHHLEPKRLRMVQQKKDSAPWLVLVEGKRNAKPSLVIQPPLIMESGGKPTQEMERIYKYYGRL